MAVPFSSVNTERLKDESVELEHSHKKRQDSLKTQGELTVLRT